MRGRSRSTRIRCAPRNEAGGCHDAYGAEDPQPTPTLPLPRFSDENLDWLRRLFDDRFSGADWCLQTHGATMTSIIRNVKVDRADSLALHDQVAAEIRRAIAEGEARPGERMPPARDLAAVLGVNSNTVLRALRLLRDEGLLEFRRGRGVTVAGTPERNAVVVRARELLEYARHQGFRSHELIEIIENLS